MNGFFYISCQRSRSETMLEINYEKNSRSCCAIAESTLIGDIDAKREGFTNVIKTVAQNLYSVT